MFFYKEDLMDSISVSEDIKIEKVIRILCIDDEEKILKAIRRLMRSIDDTLLKFQLKTTNNPLEGIELIKNYDFDIIITDFKMPIMNGDIFIKEARKIKNNFVVICMSGSSFHDIKHAGANYYIEKPFDFRTFLELLKIISS